MLGRDKGRPPPPSPRVRDAWGTRAPKWPRRAPPSRRRKWAGSQRRWRQDGGAQPAARRFEEVVHGALRKRLGLAASPSSPGGWVRGCPPLLPGLTVVGRDGCVHYISPSPHKNTVSLRLNEPRFALSSLFLSVVEVTEGNTTTVSPCTPFPQ